MDPVFREVLIRSSKWGKRGSRHSFIVLLDMGSILEDVLIPRSLIKLINSSMSLGLKSVRIDEWSREWLFVSLPLKACTGCSTEFSSLWMWSRALWTFSIKKWLKEDANLKLSPSYSSRSGSIWVGFSELLPTTLL